MVYMSTLSYIPFAYLHVTDEFILSVLLAHEYQIPITSTVFDIFIATSSCQIKKTNEEKKYVITLYGYESECSRSKPMTQTSKG